MGEDHSLSPFSAPERELIRREMGPHFGQLPTVANGLFLRTWRRGLEKGEPRLPPALRSLVEIRAGRFGPRAFFTEAGLALLRQLLQIRRAMDPARFAHLRRELCLETWEQTGPPDDGRKRGAYFRRTSFGRAGGLTAAGAAARDSRPGATFHWWPSSVITVTDFRL